MERFRSLLVAAIAGTFLWSPSFAFAQGSFFDVFTEISLNESPPAIDSFFDVFTEVPVVPDEDCDLCKAIEEEIASVQEEIDLLETQLFVIDSALNMIDDAIRLEEENLSKSKKQLEEMEDPKNYVESEGRRYDSSDHAAMGRRTANLWNAYKSGDITAQEYSDEVGKPFDDPDVARELEKLKEIIKDELRDDIQELEDNIRDGKEEREKLNEHGAELSGELEGLEAYLKELLAMLEDCNKRCKKEDVKIEDYEIKPEEQSFLDSFFDVFTELFNPPPTLDWLDELINQLEEDTGGGGGGSGSGDPVWDEIMEAIEQLDEDKSAGDSFFDVFFDIPLPPSRCHLCDPIREQIEETQESLNNLEQEQAGLDAEVEQAYHDLQTARDVQREARNALDTLNNPRSSGQLPDGSTIDSSDYAAMRVRNARLWGEYKSGDLSAQEIESEWGKSMNDPSVREELDRIKDGMKNELQDAIDRTQQAIDNLNARITAHNERLIDLAGSIAAHQAILEYLLRDLAECEKKCVMVEEEDPAMVIPDFSDFIFPQTFEIGDGTEPTDNDDNDDRDEVSEEITVNVPQECVSPAIPMSRCEQTCAQTCTKSGVRTWQVGNTVYIEDCGICPPPHIDMCPNGTVFDKAQCETDGKCECEEKAKSNDGASCYACKQKNKEVGCMIPVIGDWLCDGDDEGKVRVATGDITGDGRYAMGILCQWFGLMCKDENYDDIEDAVDCFEGTMSPKDCPNLDANNDGTVNALDLGELNFSLRGPSGYNVPLTINGMDGNDTLTPNDLSLFGGCFQNGGPACNGLGVGDPPPGFFGGTSPNDILGISPDGVRVHVQGGGGDDVIFGGPPSDNFFGFDGTTGFDGGPNPPPLPPDFFGPNNDPFGENLQIFGPGGNTFPNPPPVPASSEQQVVDRLIQEALARLRNEPLGPCEKFVITVIRQRIGNTTRYILRVTKVRDEAKCPAQCPPQTSFQAIGAPSPASCSELCQNGGGGCSVIATLADGTQCILCGPSIGDLETGGSFGGATTGGGGQGCETDADCDDDDECTEDSCNHNGVCTNAQIRDCGDKQEPCPDFAYETEAACRASCTRGQCGLMPVSNRAEACWVCADTSLHCPEGQFGSKATCDLTCAKSNGTCAVDSKTGCHVCRQTTGVRSSTSSQPVTGPSSSAQCPSGSVTSCGQCPSNTECQEDHDGCISCEPKDDGPSCPSGTTSNKSTCDSQCGQQGGTCSADNNGCYSCTVVNCPSGTYKNECPSSCSNGCNTVGSQNGVTCYQCKQDCETVCAQNDYGGPNTDHSSAILSELQGYSCVSGANISIQTATINGCSCIGDYSISVNQTPPVCTGTPCGDVVCGGSASCPGGPNETITVNCNWGGWEKIQKHQFRPIIGN